MGYNLLFVGFTIALAIMNLVVVIIVLFYSKQSRGLWQVGLIFLLEFIYTLAYALELLTPSLEVKLIFNHIQYLAIPFLVVVWLYVAKIFSNPQYIMKGKEAILFSFIPALTCLAVQAFPVLDNVYYTEAFIDTEHIAQNLGFAVLVLGKGPLYYVNVIYTAVVIGYVTLLYIRLYRTKKGTRRRESMFLALLSGVSILTILPGLLLPQTSGIDYGLYMIQILGYFILFTMFKYETIELRPSAHRAAFESSTDPILVLSDSYDIISWNEAFDKFRDRVISFRINIEDFFLNKEISEAIKNGKAYGFTYNEKHYILETVPLSIGKTRRGFIVKFNDMTSYVERIHVLDYEATHDELTGIFNRRAFMEKMERYIAAGSLNHENFALIMLDIDDFKAINDTYGHVTGDFVLEELCAVIRKALPTEVLFARYGGEEFMIMLPRMENEAAFDIAEHVRALVEAHPFAVGDLILNIHVSVGISFNRFDDGGTLRDYINKTDEAMYASKKAGKNRVTSIR